MCPCLLPHSRKPNSNNPDIIKCREKHFITQWKLLTGTNDTGCTGLSGTDRKQKALKWSLNVYCPSFRWGQPCGILGENWSARLEARRQWLLLGEEVVACREEMHRSRGRGGLIYHRAFYFLALVSKSKAAAAAAARQCLVCIPTRRSCAAFRMDSESDRFSVLSNEFVQLWDDLTLWIRRNISTKGKKTSFQPSHNRRRWRFCTCDAGSDKPTNSFVRGSRWLLFNLCLSISPSSSSSQTTLEEMIWIVCSGAVQIP